MYRQCGLCGIVPIAVLLRILWILFGSTTWGLGMEYWDWSTVIIVLSVVLGAVDFGY